MPSGVTIAPSGLRLRNGPGLNMSKIGLMAKGTPISWTETSDANGYTWYNTSGGWCAGKWVQITSEASTTQDITNQQTSQDKTEANQVAFAASTINVLEILSSLTGEVIPSFEFIKGLPYQFPRSVDRRLRRNNGDDFHGREFSKTYLMNTPIVTFSPCVPKLLGVNKFVNQGLVKSFVNALALSDTSEAEEIIQGFQSVAGGKNLKYFTTKTAYEEYIEYVNTLCRVSAIAMGLGNYNYKGTKLQYYDWSNENVNPIEMNWLKSTLGYDKSIAFAYDPNSSVSNSFNNSTTDSVMTGTLNGLSSKAREAEFLLGVGAGKEFQWSSDQYMEQVIPSLSDLKKYDPTSLMGRMMGTGATLATGANFRMPEIWSDSSIAPSYNINIKLRAPYATPLCKYLEVLVPFWHLIALGAPRLMTPNAYNAPFLIRAYSLGYFNVEMGMIDGISFTKFGDGDDISQNGVPLEMEVNVSFKDLYKVIGITKYKDPVNFFNNDGLMEFIGTTSGMNMNREDASFTFNLFTQMLQASVTEAPKNFIERGQEMLKNTAEPWLGRQ